MKVVLNSDFGGFSLSNKAFERLIELGFPYILEKDRIKEDFSEENLKIIIFDKTEDDLLGTKYHILENSYEVEDLRSHPLVVQVVEELRRLAWGNFAELEIVEIPDGIDWGIVNNEGIEWIIDWDTEGRVLYHRTKHI